MSPARRAAAPTAPRPRRRSQTADASPRRAELLQIAGEVFAEQGYRGTTVRDIAERADMLSGSLFYHFKTKEQMAEELIRPVFDELVTITREVTAEKLPVDEQISRMGARYLESLSTSLVPTRLLYNDWSYFVTIFPFLSEGFTTITKAWMKILKKGVADGILRDDIDPAIMIHIVRGVFNDVIRWYDPKGPATMQDIAGATVSIVLTGIRTR